MAENLAGLIHVSDKDPGFTRKKRGRGFIYLDMEGKKINDTTILKRIKMIGISPHGKRMKTLFLPRGLSSFTISHIPVCTAAAFPFETGGPVQNARYGIIFSWSIFAVAVIDYT